MSKRKKKYAKCPSCNVGKHRTEMKEALTTMEKLERSQYKHYAALAIDTYGVFVDSAFGWACDSCLDSKKAIKANPSIQNYCWEPHLAYFDARFTCNTCQDKFTFKKEEKQLWYEKLQFWIDSRPNNCTNCRKEIRQLKNENKTLSQILSKKETEMSTSELSTVIDIYTQWDKPQRVKYYTSVLNKRNKRK